jgi:hypothetical protein
MELRSRLSAGTSEAEIINKEDICHGSRNSSLAVGSADSDHHFACALLSLNGRIKTVPRAHGRGTELANRCPFPFVTKTCRLSCWYSSKLFGDFHVARNHPSHRLGYRLTRGLQRAWWRPLLRDRLLWRGRPRPRASCRVDTGFARKDLSFLHRKLDGYCFGHAFPRSDKSAAGFDSGSRLVSPLMQKRRMRGFSRFAIIAIPIPTA